LSENGARRRQTKEQRRRWMVAEGRKEGKEGREGKDTKGL
jgi:hypothetical protein